MNVVRLVSAAAIGVSYPSILGAVAAGILTFTAANVFAESSVALSCTEVAEDCVNEAAQCSTCQAASGACSCQRHACYEDGAAFKVKLKCAPVYVLCTEAQFADCSGKTQGVACGQGKTCQPSQCSALVEGSWVADDALGCLSAPDASTGDASDASKTGSDASSGADAGASPASDGDDSGCSTSPGSTATPSALGMSATLGMILLWARRRRARARNG